MNSLDIRGHFQLGKERAFGTTEQPSPKVVRKPARSRSTPAVSSPKIDLRNVDSPSPKRTRKPVIVSWEALKDDTLRQTRDFRKATAGLVPHDPADGRYLKEYIAGAVRRQPELPRI